MEGGVVDSETKRRLEGVSKRLKELRRLKGWSQQDLAGESGVSKGTIAWLETQKHEPHPRTMRKIAAAIGVEVSDLYPDDAFPLAQAPATPLGDLSRSAYDAYTRNIRTEEEARALRVRIEGEFDGVRDWLKGPEGRSAPAGERLKARKKLGEIATRLNVITLLETEFITALDDKREADPDEAGSHVRGKTTGELADRVAAERQALREEIADEDERKRVEEAGKAG
jgi:transcriptional regulator with XRE-family HTH domain